MFSSFIAENTHAYSDSIRKPTTRKHNRKDLKDLKLNIFQQEWKDR